MPISKNSKRTGRSGRIGYVKIYGSYAECEALYGVEQPGGSRMPSLDDADRETLGCDPGRCRLDSLRAQCAPAVGGGARPGQDHAAKRSDPDARTKRLRGQSAGPGTPRGRLRSGEHDHRLATWCSPTPGWPAGTHAPIGSGCPVHPEDHAARCQGCWPSTRRDRTDFLRHFYRRYDGASVADMDRLGPELLADHILTKAYPAALRRVREHRRLGHRTLLITGALDIVIKPLGPLFDDVICAEMSPGGRPLHRRVAERAPDRRGAGPGPARLRRGQRFRPGASRWPTPTRHRTCPYSKPSDSPWPSTLRPGWPRSPSNGVGSWRNGTKAQVPVPTRSMPFGPLPTPRKSRK